MDERANARATEDRRTDRIVGAVAEFVGREDAARMMEEIEAREDAPKPEGPAAKLARLRESVRGRRWLDEHPRASWDDIEGVRLLR